MAAADEGEDTGTVGTSAELLGPDDLRQQLMRLEYIWLQLVMVDIYVLVM